MAARPHPHPPGGGAAEVRGAAGGGHGQPLNLYLALGDSYTIGTGIDPGEDNFPAQLAARLAAAGSPVEVVNLGVNGFTTADLIAHELPHARDLRPGYVTCLIGVNDFVRGVSPGTYRDHLRHIYAAITELMVQPGQALAVSIPDFSFTPEARHYASPSAIVAGLSQLNDIGRDEAARARLPFVDIFDISRAGQDQPGWIASDGLHPSGAQYAAWVDRIWAEARWP